MKKYKFERLPVVKDKELVGVITTRDILNFYPEFYHEIREFDKIREESEKLKRIKKIRGRKVHGQGICEECGNTELLYEVDGMLLCESCANER